MKGDTLLSFAEFRLSQSRTRCELFVSAQGVAERLASGLLKPFLTHLRVAEEQANKGLHNIRLECSQRKHNAWFTKGTMERFVRFVSTPEVLEHVKTIEDELIQLELVQKIQIGDRPAHVDGPVSKNDSKPRTTKHQERNGAQTMSRRYPFDIDSDEGEASKRELLRAMNVRLLALQQEQKTAFSRAAAAGFDRDSVADLMAFADEFGANRLYNACMDFLTLFKKKYGANSELEEGDLSTGEVSFSDSDMSLESGNGGDFPGEVGAISHCDVGNSYKITYGSCEETWEPGTGERFISGPVLRKQQDVTHNTSGRCSMQGQKIWDPSENLYVGQHRHPVTIKGSNTISVQKAQSIDQSVRECFSQVEPQLNNQQCSTSNSKLIYSSSEEGYFSSKTDPQNKTNSKEETPFSQLQEMAEKVDARRAERLRERNYSMSMEPCREAQAENSENLDMACERHETEHLPSQTSMTSSKQDLEYKAVSCELDISGPICTCVNSENLCEVPSSPKRPASLHPKAKVGPGAKQGSLNFHSVSDGPSEEHSIHNSIRNEDSDCSASYAKYHGNSNLSADSKKTQAVSTEPVRRLSVQDAINLFESKRRDSIDVSVKRLTKQESGKGSAESGNSSLPRKSVLRRWSGANELASELSSHQSRDSMLENQGTTSKPQLDICKPTHEENANALTDGRCDGLAEEKSQNQYSVIISEEFKEPKNNVSSTLQLQHNLGHESQPLSETHDRHFQQKQQAVHTSSRSMDTECRSLSEVELTNGLMKEAMSNDLETVVSSKYQDDNLEAKKHILKGKITRMTEAGQTNLMQSTNTGELILDQGKTCLLGDALETSDNIVQDNVVVTASCRVLNQQSDIESQTMRQSTVSENKQNSVMAEHSSFVTQNVAEEHYHKIVQSVNEIEPKVLSVHKVHSSSLIEKNKEKMGVVASGRGNTTSKIQQKGRKEYSGSSQDNASSDVNNIQEPTNIVEHRNNNQVGLQGDGLCEIQRGNLYEHYSKLRDAKLKQEHVSKRAERELKLKALAETLDRSKAEMKSRTARTSRRNHLLAQGQVALKSETVKANSLSRQKKQEGEEEEETDQDEYQLQLQDQTSGCSTPLPLAPCVRNGVLESKLHAVKKSTFQKSTTPSSSSRVLSSLSPKPVPKNPVSTVSVPWRSAVSINQPNITENPLTRSAPSFADLRKDNAKPSSGRTSGSRVHLKNNNCAGNQIVETEAAPLEAGSDAAAASFGNKEDTRKILVLTRKSCVSVDDLKFLSEQGQEDEVLTSLNAQNEGTAEPVLYSKIRRSAVAPIQEAKPFLRKGQGIGPGAGPGVMKLKASSAMVDETKSSDEETPSPPSLNIEDVPEKDVPGSTSSGTGSEADASVNSAEMLAGQLPLKQETQPEATEVLTLDGPPDSSENDKVDHTIPFPADSVNCKQEDGMWISSAPLSQLLAKNTAGPEQSDASLAAAASFRADSLQHEHMIAISFSPTSSSLPQSGRISDRFSPPSTVALESPPGSPISWNSSQIPYISETDVQGRKTRGNPHRPLIAVTQHPSKEPAKGLKRLLKFGRKNRSSETAATDWVSASTTSEGDDDLDETRDLGSGPAEDLSRRAKMQEKGSVFRNTNGHRDSYSSQDQGTIQSLRSSIPAPPAHFKLREDHLSGGTLLKAPRSFFSLSSFRSKGSEGKAR